MLHLPTFLAFYAAALAIQLSPGPDMLLVIGRGVGQGRRTAFMSAVRMTLVAGFIQVLLLALGIASLVQASPFAFEMLRWVGAAYLMWLGARPLVGSGRRSVGARGRRRAGPSVDPIDQGARSRDGLRHGGIGRSSVPDALGSAA